MQQQLDQIVASYLQLHQILTQEPVELAMAAEPLKQLRAAGGELAGQAQGHPAMLAKTLAATSQQAPETVEALRESFGNLSRDLIELVKLLPPTARATTTGELYHAYCPMVKKDWLQSGKAVENPYDPAMPKCGSIKQQIAVTDAAKE